MTPYDDKAAIFPRHDIDPKLKKAKPWNLAVAKAIWNGWQKGMPDGSAFYAKRERCAEIRDYCLNKQSTSKYLTWQTGEETPDTAFFNIDQSTDAIVKTHRQKILGRLKKIGYNIIATPIDAKAKTKLDAYYNEAKVKIMQRDAAMQVAPELAQHPLIAKQAGEPMDLEELEMEMEFNPKFIRSKNAEQGISMIFYENDIDTLVSLIDEDVVDFGAGIFKEGIDKNNRVYIEFVPYTSFICSKAENAYFKKLSYAGHVKPVSLSDLAGVFKEEDLKVIADHFSGKDGNPSNMVESTDMTRGYDDFKGYVLQYEYRSYDLKVTKEERDRRGNLKFNLTDPANLNKKDTAGDQIEYDGKNYEMIYTGNWIIGTDYIYEYGLATNQKRSMQPKKLNRTELSYHVVASSFDKMCTRGITEDLIPIADEIQMTVLKLRNLNNRMIINGLAIDFSALENVSLGGSGEKALTPQENLDMLLQIGIIGYRSEEILADGKNQRKPVEALILDYANQFSALWQNYTNNVNKLYDISGLNQTTDSATVNPKMLVGVANAQNAGTSNALFHLEDCRRKLIEKLAKNVIQRLQAALLLGPYEGYVQTLGKNTIEFLRFQEKHLPTDYDLRIEDKPSDEQKQILYASMQNDIKAGLLHSGDVFSIMNSYNLKDAEILLTFRANKAREKQEVAALNREKMNGQINIESAKAAEAEKRITLELQSKLKKEEYDVQGAWVYKTEEMKVKAKSDDVVTASATKIIESTMSASATGESQDAM